MVRSTTIITTTTTTRVTIYDLKPRFQALLRPLCRALAAGGITANQVTLLALLLSLAVGSAMALNPERTALFVLLPLTLFVRMALNAIDGMLAREHGQKSHLGAFLNELSDVASDAALYLPFALLGGWHAPLAVAVTLLAALTEMAGVVATQIGASRRYDGPMGKSDRAFVLGSLGLALGLGVRPGAWSLAVMALVGLLSLLTIARRIQRALAEAQR